MPDPATALEALRFDLKRRQLRVLAAILMVPLLVFGVTDVLLSNGDWHRLIVPFAIRFGFLTVGSAFMFRLARATNERRFDAGVVAASYLIAALLLTLHLSRPSSFITPYFVEIVLVFALYTMLPASPARQAGPALVITGGAFAHLAFRQTGTDVVQYIAIVTALFLSNAVGIALGWHRGRLERREKDLVASVHEARAEAVRTAAALEKSIAELRILRGIIPICSHCRHVRDHDGDWDELEAYVKEHSDTRFSHGICPDCLEELFPEGASARI